MAKTPRTVKYVLDRALRRVGAKTSLLAPSKDNEQLAFDSYIDMLKEWEESGVTIVQVEPSNIQASIGDQDLVSALINCLAVRIAPDFYFNVTGLMAAQAAASFRILRNKQLSPAVMKKPSNMPRGSGNRWYYYIGSDDDEEVITTETDVNILTG